MVEVWSDKFKPVSCTPVVKNFTRGGALTITGRRQRVLSDAGYWVFSYEGISIYDRQGILEWDSLIVALRQGESVDARIYLDTKAKGSNDSGSSALISVDKALRSTQLNVDLTGIEIMRGDRFSIGENFYQITNIVSLSATIGIWNPVSGDVSWDDSVPWFDTITAVNGVIDIIPPLRQAVSISDSLEFDSPICRCVIFDMNSGNRKSEYGVSSKNSLVLQEKT